MQAPSPANKQTNKQTTQKQKQSQPNQNKENKRKTWPQHKITPEGLTWHKNQQLSNQPTKQPLC